MKRVELMLMATSVTYVVVIITLYLNGMSFVAAYLTMPGWYVVAVPVLGIFFVGPQSLADLIGSWGGNLLMLLISAILNAATVYLGLRALLRGKYT